MKITRAAALTVLLSTLMLAQGPQRGNRPEWTPQQAVQARVNRLAQHLSLTEDQKTRATTIYSEAVANTTNARTSLQETRTSLNDAVKKNDTTAIDRLSVTLGSLSGQITAVDTKAEAAFYALLTAEQKAKYDEGRGPRGGPGPMGPGREGFRR